MSANLKEKIVHRAARLTSFLLLTATFATAQDSEFTSEFTFGDRGFSNAGTNPYFSLVPGYKLTLEGEEDGEEVVVILTVLDETETVDGVVTRVVEEYESIDGEVAEISRNFFALCNRTNSLVYFGEDVDIYEDGEIVSHDGAWRAGVDGAKAGILLPGLALLGARHYQEVAPGIAEDRAEIISIDETVETEAGVFTNCLMVEETTPLEPDALDYKYYAPGVGIISDGPVTLTEIEGDRFLDIPPFDQQSSFTEHFLTETCVFSSIGRNPYFILEPGYQLVYEGEEDDEFIELIITVLDETETINGIETRVVEEYESIDGELYEVSRNFFAICQRTNNVFYFGEDVDFYEDGEIIGHDGAWRAGVNGAIPGIQIPGEPLFGSRYFQEIAPDTAMDQAEILNTGETIETPYGTFTNALKTAETTPLEPDALEHKYYAKGIGLISDGVLMLTQINTPSAVGFWELMN